MIEVLRELPERSHGHIVCEYRCACGALGTANASDIRAGKVISCGCLKKQRMTELGHANRTHGYASHKTGRTPTYRTWRAMHQRCDGRRPGHPDNKNYRDRGVKVCERWASFENFLADMGERPAGKTLDRWPNKNGDYEPGNCRWATAHEQALNRRPKGSL